ncbi:hypothetical protein BofuT4_uP137130.1 [Botrytis cinerea T4]|uniref:Uncharacterized protein n=1 Tax=Botryotinia fuckeliana (strain T4) TaxID=999810 RepID=G2YPX0_BOTF4|nr:hypothetical protein BofuT4_uP137130.1 [Botrytis cinerea T4]
MGAESKIMLEADWRDIPCGTCRKISSTLPAKPVPVQSSEKRETTELYSSSL